MHDTYVRFYGRLVLSGRMSIDDVPALYRADVEQWVIEHGGTV